MAGKVPEPPRVGSSPGESLRDDRPRHPVEVEIRGKGERQRFGRRDRLGMEQEAARKDEAVPVAAGDHLEVHLRDRRLGESRAVEPLGQALEVLKERPFVRTSKPARLLREVIELAPRLMLDDGEPIQHEVVSTDTQ